jgi:uncharacterized protein (DUF433 family)
MDFWADCEFVERVAGKVGGRPVIKGTRIEPEVLIVEAELGRTPEETHEDFPTLPVSLIRTIQAFAEKQRQLVP